MAIRNRSEGASALTFFWGGGSKGCPSVRQLPDSLQSPLPSQALLSVSQASTASPTMLELCGKSRAQTPVLERVQQEKEGHRPLMFIGSVSKEHVWGPLAAHLLSLERSHPSLHSALGPKIFPCLGAGRCCSRAGLDTSQYPCAPLQRQPLHTPESQKRGRARRSWAGSAEPP